MNLIQQLESREFEHRISVAQLLYYSVERRISHALLRRYPPQAQVPNLLNLGCGPHIYPGWVNADDYAPKRRLRQRSFRPNWTLDITRRWRCADNYWDGMFTEHVIEHLSYAEAVVVFRESLRTLRPGAWLRISVPDLARYVDFYKHKLATEEFHPFPHRALALSFLTQMHSHKSVWDADLMSRILSELGFVDISVVSFGNGTDMRVIKDDPDKKQESMYIEARKPIS